MKQILNLNIIFIFTLSLWSPLLDAQDSSRRNFIKCVFSLSAGGALTFSAAKGLDNILNYPGKDQFDFESVLDTKDDKSLSFTATEALLIQTAEIVWTNLLLKMNVQTGRASGSELNQMLQQKPISAIAAAGVAAPIAEETIFRLLVPTIFGESWTTGILSNLIFAGVHSFKDGKLDFSKIPLQQFVGGIYYWYLMKYRGFDHAVLAHSVQNTYLSIAVAINYRLSR